MGSVEEAVETLLRDAQTADVEGKVAAVTKLTEYLVHRSPDLLTKYMDSLLDMKVDPRAPVKKAVLEFIDRVARQTPKHMHLALPSLDFLVQSDQEGVSRRALAVATGVYRRGFRQLLSRSPDATADAPALFRGLTVLLDRAEARMRCPDELPRTQAIKFLETAAFVLSFRNARDRGALQRLADKPDRVSVAGVPPGHPVLRVTELEARGRALADALCGAAGEVAASMDRLVDEADAGGTLGLDSAPAPRRTQLSLPNATQLVHTLAALAAHRAQFADAVARALLSLGPALTSALRSRGLLSSPAGGTGEVSLRWGGVSPACGRLVHTLRVAAAKVLRLRTVPGQWEGLCALLSDLGWSTLASRTLAAVRRAGEVDARSLVVAPRPEAAPAAEAAARGPSGGGGVGAGDAGEADDDGRGRSRSHSRSRSRSQAAPSDASAGDAGGARKRRRWAAAESTERKPVRSLVRPRLVPGPPLEAEELYHASADALTRLIVANIHTLPPPPASGPVPHEPAGLRAAVLALHRAVGLDDGAETHRAASAAAAAAAAADGSAGTGAKLAGLTIAAPSPDEAAALVPVAELRGAADAAFERVLSEGAAEKALSCTPTQARFRWIVASRVAMLQHTFSQGARARRLLEFALDQPEERFPLLLSLLHEASSAAPVPTGVGAAVATPAQAGGATPGDYDALLIAAVTGLLAREAAPQRRPRAAAAVGGGGGGGGGSGGGGPQPLSARLLLTCPVPTPAAFDAVRVAVAAAASAGAEAPLAGPAAAVVATLTALVSAGAESAAAGGAGASASAGAGAGSAAETGDPAAVAVACSLGRLALGRLLRYTGDRRPAVRRSAVEGVVRSVVEVGAARGAVFALARAAVRSVAAAAPAGEAEVAAALAEAAGPLSAAALDGYVGGAPVQNGVPGGPSAGVTALGNALVKAARVGARLAAAGVVSASAGADEDTKAGATDGVSITPGSVGAAAVEEDVPAAITAGVEEEEDAAAMGARLLDLPSTLCARAPSVLTPLVAAYAGTVYDTTRAAIERAVSLAAPRIAASFAARPRDAVAVAGGSSVRSVQQLAMRRRATAAGGGQTVFLEALPPLEGETGLSAADLLSRLVVPSERAESAMDLSVVAARALVEAGNGSAQAIASRAFDLFSRSGDARLVAPVAGALARDLVLRAAPRLCAMPAADFRRLIRTLGETRGAPTSPVDFLLHIHNLPESALPADTLSTAVAIALGETDVVTTAIASKLLLSLVSLDPWPAVLTTTAAEALRLHAALADTLTGVLSEMARRAVWEDEHHFRGWAVCLQRLHATGAPDALNVLLQVPHGAHLDTVFAVAPGLRAPAVAYAADPKVAANLPHSVRQALAGNPVM